MLQVWSLDQRHHLGMLRNANSQPQPGSTKSDTVRGSPAICVLTSSPSHSDGHSALGSTAPEGTGMLGKSWQPVPSFSPPTAPFFFCESVMGIFALHEEEMRETLGKILVQPSAWC